MILIFDNSVLKELSEEDFNNLDSWVPKKLLP